MFNLLSKLILSIFILSITAKINAQQQPPYWSDIKQFKKMDAQNRPPQNAILFIGSSSFTNWKDVQDYFPAYTIINRGFGGSTLKDQLYYFNDLVPVYRPRQIVIYCGENDLANDETPADSAVQRFKRLYILIRNYDKNVPVAYISIKPSPSRMQYEAKFISANKQIRQFLQGKDNSEYINVYNAMLNEDGRPKPEIFLGDSLHMNKQGYAIWQKIIQPYLINKH